MKRFVKVYQYQLEFEGGMRYGPHWMHRDEAKMYLKQQITKEQKKLKVKRFWMVAAAKKFNPIVKPEFVR